jgi:hypothetical protein
MFFEIEKSVQLGVVGADFRLNLGRFLKAIKLPQQFYFSINQEKSLGKRNCQFFENQGFTLT